MIKVEKATRENIPASEHERIADPETICNVLIIKGNPRTIFAELCSLIISLRQHPLYSKMLDLKKAVDA